MSFIILKLHNDKTSLWHNRAKHFNLKLLRHIESPQIVKGLLEISNKVPSLCPLCQQGKQTHGSYYKMKNYVSTPKCLKLIHMDLVGPM